MRRTLSLVLLLVLFAIVPIAFAQDGGSHPIPDASQAMGSDLIAWSEMQTPEPVPAQNAPAGQPTQSPTPDPRPETPAPRDQAKPASPDQGTSQQPGDAGTAQNPSNGQADTAAQTFTGTISKEADSYVLKVADTTSYKLDNQDKAKDYENQKVRVTGSLDKGTDMIHVQKIEPLS